MRAGSAQIAGKFAGLVVKPWENAFQVGVAEVGGNGLAQHTAKIRGHCQVTSFVELRLFEPGPAAVYAASTDRAAHHKHDVGVAVVGAAVAVLARGSAEF